MQAILTVPISAELADLLPTFLSDAERDLGFALAEEPGSSAVSLPDVSDRDLADSIATDLDKVASRMDSLRGDTTVLRDRTRLVFAAEETRRVAKLLRAVVSAARGIE